MLLFTLSGVAGMGVAFALSSRSDLQVSGVGGAAGCAEVGPVAKRSVAANTGTVSVRSPWDRVEELVALRDSVAFTKLARDLTAIIDDSERATYLVGLCLRMENVGLARELSAQMLASWESSSLSNLVATLAPPRILGSGDHADDGGLERSREWLARHGANHRGNWVAVKDGRLLGSAVDLGLLRSKVASLRDPDVLLARIPV